MTVSRARHQQQLRAALADSPVVALLGPRQCGKTTLAREVAAETPLVTYLDLEDPRDDARLTEPMLALERLTGLVVLDEIQLRPELFAILRVLADRVPLPARFLVLGSASPRLVKGASETLAGRVRFIDLAGFDLTETGVADFHKLWLRGGFPRSFLAPDDQRSLAWRQDFVRTFLTRDVPQLGITIPAPQLRRFWMMLAHYHGQTWNASAIGASLGIGYKTVQNYLDILAGAFLVRQLQPWTENVGKRVRKAPKVYFTDTGLLHALLGIDRFETLEAHPRLGASFEGFAAEQLIRVAGWRDDEVFYWGTHAGAELDLLAFFAGRRYGFEFKYADAPRPTRSMRAAIEDLRLERLFIVHPGAASYPLGERLEVVGLGDLPALAVRLGGG